MLILATPWHERQHGIVGKPKGPNATPSSNPNSFIYSVHELANYSAIYLAYKVRVKIIAMNIK